MESTNISQEALLMGQKFEKKFSIKKDTLNKKDLTGIISAIYSNTKESLFLDEIANKIFYNLDKTNSGEIKTNDLMEYIISNTQRINLFDFFSKMDKELHTKSEDIIYRLKKLKRKDWVINSKHNFCTTIDEIITSISDKNLNEIDSSNFKRVNTKKNSFSHMCFIEQYSKMGEINQKEKDNEISRNDFSSRNSNNNRFAFSEDNKSLFETRSNSTELNMLISPSIIAKVYKEMDKIDQCDFNIFELDKLLGKKASVFIANEILERFEYIQNGTVEPQTFKNFLIEIAEHYDRINAIYHNDLHATDVMQTCFVVFEKGRIEEKLKLIPLDLFSLLVAAYCHDFKHTGQNNLYHINSKSKIAMRYNDISVLENYHISQSFKVMSKKKFDILMNFSPPEYRQIRRRFIEGILATDMANHAKVFSSLKNKVELYDIKKGKNFEMICEDEPNKNLAKLFDNQQIVLNMILHTADISNAGKPSKISEQWVSRVYGEFFMQGDLEKKKGLPVSNFCDRETTNINKAMIGFITFIVGPTIEALVNIIPEVNDYNDYCKNNLKKHKLGAKNDERKERQIKEQ